MPDLLLQLGEAFNSWYESLSNGYTIFFLFACLAGCFVVLTKGAGLLVDGAAGLASGLGVPKIIIGATVVSLGTTLPEASASIMASLAAKSDPQFVGIAAGNAVGSIICNAGLVFSLCCLLVRLPVSHFTLNRNAWFQIGGAALLVLLFLLSGSLPGDEKQRLFYRAFGMLSYTILSVRWARQSVADNGRDADGQGTTHNIAKPVLLTATGFVLVIVSAYVLVAVVRELALKLGVPSEVVAVTLLALGTSIPELATGVMSLIKGHKGLLVGTVIGANILNIFFVIGASATVNPLVLSYRFFWLHLPVMLIILGLFHLNIWTSRDHLKRWPGLIMLIIYLGYAVGIYFIRSYA